MCIRDSSYIIYGPLSAGATTVMFEGVPTFPDAGRFWQVIDKHGVNIFYTCLLYTSDAADERSSVDLGGRRIIKKKTRV